MAQKNVIIDAINKKVGSTRFEIWRIGLTHDRYERKKYWRETEKQNVQYWSDWTAESLSDAQEIEAMFIKKGMKGGTGGDLSSRYTVYIYVF